ncbi:hypothetical protein PAMA_014055 [Pampus argenteus]
MDFPFMVHFLSGALASSTVLVVFLSVCMMKKRNYQCTGSPFPATPTPNAELGQDAENLHYAVVSSYEASRPSIQQADTQRECVYSRLEHVSSVL